MYKIIGAGLIGGALAKKLESKHIDFEIWDNSTKTLDEIKDTLHHAKVCDTFEELVDSQSSGQNLYNIFVLAVPLRAMRSTIIKLKELHSFTPQDIIVDVGSTKRVTVKTIDELDLNEYYCGTHPMAGTHLSGFTSSSQELLDNACWVVTPSMAIPLLKVDFLEYQIQDIFDGKSVNINSAVHDDTTALISHLPHIFATEIANLVEDYNDTDLALALAAGSYKDAVRVAASDPRKTEAMVLENSKPLALYLRKVAQDFINLAQSLEAIDDRTETLEEDNKNAPKLIRDFFDHPKTVRQWRQEIN